MAICVSSGSYNQGNEHVYKYPGRQCIAIATACLVFKHINNLESLNREQIDRLMFAGDKFYGEVVSDTTYDSEEIYLSIEDFPSQFIQFGTNTSISPRNVIYQGFHDTPEFYNSFENNVLKKILSHDNKNIAGFIFTFLQYSVCFWKGRSKYYLFNSHAVSITRATDANGKARLFECSSLKELTLLLFLLKPKGAIEGPYASVVNYQQYDICCLLIPNSNNPDCRYPNLLENMDIDIIPTNLDTNIPKLISNVQENGLDATMKDGISFRLLSDDETPDLFPNDQAGVSYISLDTVGTELSVDITELETDVTPTNVKSRGRPVKKTRGRKKTVFKNRSEQIRTAQKTHRDKNPLEKETRNKEYYKNNTEVHAARTTIYKEINKELQAKAVRTYKEKNPEVQAKAVRTYKEKNPEVQAKAVQTYKEKNPEVQAKAVRTYKEKNPEVQAKAIKTYINKNPDVQAKAVKVYKAKNPQVQSDSARDYAVRNPQINKTSVINYNTRTISTDCIQTDSTNQSHGIRFENNAQRRKRESILPPSLHKYSLIGLISGTDLNDIPLFSAKNTSLNSPNTRSCRFCGAKFFDEEKYKLQWCCKEGRLVIDELSLQPLTAGFYGEREFYKNVRSYNNAFAFSASAASGGFVKPNSGISFVKVCGRVYHRIFDLSYSKSRNNIAMYIDDGEERKRDALGLKNALNIDIVNQIQFYIQSVNPFVSQLRSLANEASENAHIIFQEVTRRRDGPVLGEQPTSREIAAILNTTGQTYENTRSVVCWKIGESKPHTIDLFSACYETLQYPLLFPHGEAGWRINIKGKRNLKISQICYYRYRYFSDDRFSNMGRLSQEYFVDMYCRYEEEKLQYIGKQQDNLRVVDRNEIIEAEGNQQLGKIYLPSSFTGSPRYFLAKYQDAMAIVNKFGNVTYFITMTCNPKWDEITQNLGPFDKVPPPALLCRVFNIKVNYLLSILKSGYVFGPLDYVFYTIEFQKRGLPHLHLCAKSASFTPKTNVEIDKVIRADIPRDNDQLRSLVLKHMIHGPCGETIHKNICIDPDTKKCTKFFPKPHCEVTHIDDRGFPIYRRDVFNVTHIERIGKTMEVSDAFVVPYNPALLLIFDCHINCELASSRKSVKYLFKYITKGPDQARVSICSTAQLENNEIENYATKRYIGAAEALWRIFEFTLCSRTPNVETLPVHLPGHDCIMFRKGQDIEDAASRTFSKLTIYLNRPRLPEFENVTYAQFYEEYRIEAINANTHKKKSRVPMFETVNKTHIIMRRQMDPIVSRLFWVTPNKGEQYFLRILLSRFPCYQLDELKIVDNQSFDTFQEAAISLGLVQTENEYIECMEEAKNFMTAIRLRQFFCLLINIGAPAEFLWQKFKYDLCEDFLLNMNSQDAFNRGLSHIDRILRSQNNSSLEKHGLPEALQDLSTEVGREVERFDFNEIDEFLQNWLPKLNVEQRMIFEYILNAVNEPTGNRQNLIFIHEQAGSGKTLLCQVITASLRKEKRIVLCTATSGIAALNHEGGITAHSMFRLPIDVDNPNSYWSLTSHSERAELIKEASLIIFDEAAMAHKNLVHCLERSFRDLMQSEAPMGGKVFMALGDFRQIGPIVRYGSPDDVVAASIRNSYLWPYMKVFTLTKALRTRDDVDYTEFLINVGNGHIPTQLIDDHELIPLINISFVTSLNDLIDDVYPNSVLQDSDACANRAILCATYVHIREINSVILNRLGGEKIEVHSADFLPDCSNADDNYLGVEALNLVKHPGVPDHFMEYKVGCVCIILRNISFAEKLCNGTKVIIIGKRGPVIEVRKPHESTSYLIPRIDFTFEVTGFRNIQMTRRAYPLLPCYCMSINKAQGQTISYVGCDLRGDVFAHGMLYVALGRVRSRNDIIVLVTPNRVDNGIAYTKNVVYNGLTI